MEVIIPAERTLTQVDYVRLTRLLRQQPAAAGTEAMQELLEASELVAPPAVPPTVVTMYTQVLLQDVDGGEPYKRVPCYPEDADPAQGFVSVLSPAGMGLLGLRAGEIARWRPPGGEERAARILSILFQPEASGDYET